MIYLCLIPMHCEGNIHAPRISGSDQKMAQLPNKRSKCLQAISVAKNGENLKSTIFNG